MSLTSPKALMQLSAVRQVLGLLVVFVAITIIAGGVTFWLVKKDMYRVVDERLKSRMEAAISVVAIGKHLPLPKNGQTAVIATERVPEGFQTVDHSISTAVRGDQFRFLAQTTPYGQIVLGENTERQEELRDILEGGIQLALLGTLASAIMFGLWVARRAQARFNIINQGLALIAQGNFKTRIKLNGPNDDLSILAERINDTT